MSFTGFALYMFTSVDFAHRLSHEELRSASGATLAAVSFNQELNERLGAPITRKEATMQKLEALPDGGFAATLRVNLSGPAMDGQVVATLSRGKAPGSWTFLGGTFYPRAGPPIRLTR